MKLICIACLQIVAYQNEKEKQSCVLQKRALRLQQIKQKEALNREQQREQELRREQELIGRPMGNQ